MSSTSREIAIWKCKIMFLGKVWIIIQQCHVNKNINELKHYRWVKLKGHWMVFGNNSSFMKFKIKQHIKTSRLLLKFSLIVVNMEKTLWTWPTVPYITLTALEIVSWNSLFIFFIVKLELISHLVLVYLFLTWACYCLIRFLQ